MAVSALLGGGVASKKKQRSMSRQLQLHILLERPEIAKVYFDHSYLLVGCNNHQKLEEIM